MGHWLDRNIVEPGKLPLLLALAAFVLTFADHPAHHPADPGGQGPVPQHHARRPAHPPCRARCRADGRSAASARWPAGGTASRAGVCAVIFGMGVGLVLDEFALILHLDDVYWTEEGRQERGGRRAHRGPGRPAPRRLLPLRGQRTRPARRCRAAARVILSVVVNFLFVLIALVKGKARMAIFGVWCPFVALFGAIRLARPDSPLGQPLLPPPARAPAPGPVLRAYRHDRRWAAPRRRFED